MSEYAVHFTKAAEPASEYDVMLKILSEGRIIPGGPFGAARNLPELSESQKSACFSEIPLDLLERLIERAMARTTVCRWRGSRAPWRATIVRRHALSGAGRR